MAASTNPVFVDTPKCWAATLSAANTNRDGTGTVVTVLSAAVDGTKIEHIDICAAGTTTAGVIRLFLHDGTNYFLWDEILVTAITPSATIQVWDYTVDCSPAAKCLVLPTGWSLRASTHNAETFKVVVVGGDF